MLPALSRVGLTAPRAAAVFRAQKQVASRRGYASSKDGTSDGQSKLAFRFGLKDVPIELYPMFVVVIAACGGAIFACSRHFIKDGDLRLVPTAFKKTPPPTQH